MKLCHLVTFLILPMGVFAQGLNRKQVPPPGPPPTLHVPAWSKAVLPNGADLIVAEKHELPLISFSITFRGGAREFEPAARQGLASITAALLTEGTTTRTGDELADVLQLLGTSVQTSITADTGSINFVTTAPRFAAVLDVVSDMLLHPTFDGGGLERLRAQRLVNITMARAQPWAIANRVFPRIVYGADHPYGRVVTETSIKAITRQEVVAFHATYFQPGRALVTIVGDTTLAAVKPVVEQALATWRKAGQQRSSFSVPTPADIHQTKFFLVDKPGAAQSTVTIGRPGPPRNTPDYFALEVMNTMLGGMFQSRLNANIREDKGYSYGVASGFEFGKGPGPFTAGGDVVSDKTAAALTEFTKELRGMGGDRPVTEEELLTAKNVLIRRMPEMFSSVTGINDALAELWREHLPESYYEEYPKRIGAITKDDVVRVARKYIDVDKLAVVVVGDRASIEQPLKDTKIGPIQLYDAEGNPTPIR